MLAVKGPAEVHRRDPVALADRGPSGDGRWETEWREGGLAAGFASEGLEKTLRSLLKQRSSGLSNSDRR